MNQIKFTYNFILNIQDIEDVPIEYETYNPKIGMIVNLDHFADTDIAIFKCGASKHNIQDYKHLFYDKSLKRRWLDVCFFLILQQTIFMKVIKWK